MVGIHSTEDLNKKRRREGEKERRKEGKKERRKEGEKEG
jgi:hypothetical protein